MEPLHSFQGVKPADVLLVVSKHKDKNDPTREFEWRRFVVVDKVVGAWRIRGYYFRDTIDQPRGINLNIKRLEKATLLSHDEYPDGIVAFRTGLIMNGYIEMC